jgi:hypothetical protein
MPGRPSGKTAQQVEDLLAVGCELWDVSRTLGLKPDSLIRACQRAERHDLAAQISEMVSSDRERVKCLRSAA